jgi:hypothetical protein
VHQRRAYDMRIRSVYTALEVRVFKPYIYNVVIACSEKKEKKTGYVLLSYFSGIFAVFFFFSLSLRSAHDTTACICLKSVALILLHLLPARYVTVRVSR